MLSLHSFFFFVFFFNDTATTEIYTLSLHDALPICEIGGQKLQVPSWTHLLAAQDLALGALCRGVIELYEHRPRELTVRSEEHTSELQSQSNLVCRLLLEKKKKETELRIVAS